MATLESIRYSRNPLKLEILNQILLPHQTLYEAAYTIQDGYSAIKQMKVRGAPAIAIVAALSLAVELQRRRPSNTNGNTNSNSGEDENTNDHAFKDVESVVKFIFDSLNYLKTSRPTAVNLFRAADDIWKITKGLSTIAEDPNVIIDEVVKAAEGLYIEDIQNNKDLGDFGAEYIINHSKERQKNKKVQVLTHCNTGSLATGGYGTALGIIRSLHSKQQLSHAYCTETRPYNQGSRLTAYELLHEKIPSTLILAIIVGADRVASNGDTANKIGTLQLAITAKYYGIMFIVAAPSSSIDLNIKSGNEIIIEERAQEEVTFVGGVDVLSGEMTKVKIAPEKVHVWNPSFDVTPAALITAIVTEKGVAEKVDGKDEFDLVGFLVDKGT
ncbi:2561_t:CDS:2 [Ambispora leptoticha]|uniref:Methylthioribose-1-phosphate isomerase n=1 Tax=Ambispora leptoticha TaxID=144679 RepID=A0A9N9BGK6_9GLOM|nr:2561_t:CDS:2 [Ambispora leptoticha]